MPGDAGEWISGARCAVSLTYDGALRDHVELVRPMLERTGLRGTFYVTPEGLLDCPAEWVGMCGEGHEIGNHSLFGVTLPDGNLPNWDLTMVHADLELTQRLLYELMPSAPHTSFAYPGDHSECAGGCYQAVVRDMFQTARTSHEGLNERGDMDLHALRSVATFGRTGDRFIREVERAMKAGAWLIFRFTGVGSGDMSCDLQAHTELCLWLEQAKGSVLVAPVSEIATSLVGEPATL